MTQIKKLEALSRAEQLRIGYLMMPMPGYYRFEAKDQVLFSGKLAVIACAIYKPLNGTKADKGHKVHVPLLPMILSEGPLEDRKILASGDIVDYVLVIRDVSTRTNSNLLEDLVVDWKLRKLPKYTTVEEMNNHLNSDHGDKLIEGFLSDQRNLMLFNDDEVEEEIEDAFVIDDDPELDYFDDDDH